MVTDKEWCAIKNNDKTYDALFRYAVKTTKIFCRPSCPSRLPKREHVTVYYDLTEPEKNGYRPCKRCQPTGVVVGATLWVAEIKTIIEKQYASELPLSELSYLARGSESYLRHVFKQETQQTPQQYLMEVRLKKASELLKETPLSVERVGNRVGVSNTSYFIKCFKDYFGYTPRQYRILKRQEVDQNE